MMFGMDVVVYRRVSTQEQGGSGLGLQAQQDRINEYVGARGWTVVGDFEETMSGKALQRPKLTQALHMVETGRAGALVVAKLDRLSRSLLQFVELLERSHKEKWSLVALDLGIDTSSPSGEMVAHVLMSFAQFERRLIGQRTKDALAVKRAKGENLGRPKVAPTKLVSKITDLHDRGMSFGEIARQLNADEIATLHGGREWYASTVRGILLSSKRK